MHRLQRLTRWYERALALTLCSSLSAGCSAGGGQDAPSPQRAPSDGVTRTANGQVILPPAAAAQPAAAGNGSGLAPEAPTPGLLAPNEGPSGAEIPLDPGSDAGANPGGGPDPAIAAPDPPEDDDDDDDDDDD